MAAERWQTASGTGPAEFVDAGDAGGGGLTVAAQGARRDAGDPLTAAAVCVSAWADLE